MDTGYFGYFWKYNIDNAYKGKYTFITYEKGE